MGIARRVTGGDKDVYGLKWVGRKHGTENDVRKLGIFEPLTNSGIDTMMRALLLLAFVSILGTGLTAGTTVRILPTPRQANVDGMPGASIKRMPLGGEFLLTVNKGEDVSFYQLQWFKNGVAIPGQTGQ